MGVTGILVRHRVTVLDMDELDYGIIKLEDHLRSIVQRDIPVDSNLNDNLQNADNTQEVNTTPLKAYKAKCIKTYSHKKFTAQTNK